MVQNVKVGNMEAFCGGTMARYKQLIKNWLYNLDSLSELWKDHLEKSLAMRADWVDKILKNNQSNFDGSTKKPRLLKAGNKEELEIVAKRR